LNIGITAIPFHTTPTNGILFEVEGFRIWHSIENLAERANLLAGRTD
jgi:hypothetical protein